VANLFSLMQQLGAWPAKQDRSWKGTNWRSCRGATHCRRAKR